MNFLFYRHPLSAILSPVFLCCTVCFYALQSLSTESFINKFRSLNHRWKSVLDKELGLPKSISTTLMRLWEGRLKVKEMYEVFGDFPYSSISKVSACNAEDLGSIPGSGRSPGEEHGNPLQYSCLENPIDRGAWRAIAHEVTRVRHDLATKPLPPPWSVFHLLPFCPFSELRSNHKRYVVVATLFIGFWSALVKGGLEHTVERKKLTEEEETEREERSGYLFHQSSSSKSPQSWFPCSPEPQF